MRDTRFPRKTIPRHVESVSYDDFESQSVEDELKVEAGLETRCRRGRPPHGTVTYLAQQICVEMRVAGRSVRGLSAMAK